MIQYTLMSKAIALNFMALTLVGIALKRSIVELLIVTTEMGDEGPVSNLYRLPEKHAWAVQKWEHLKSGEQGIYLKSTTFESNRPDSQSTEEIFLLTTTFLKAELNAL